MLATRRCVRLLSMMTRTPPRNPLIAIVGATGTGKSQLAVELAKRYNGEIINGDAMQLYAGLPIITNKITAEEQAGIPHHLLGQIGLHEQTWVVGTFVRNALKTIDEIRSRGRLPILVGGTHYYTQSLLFHDRLARHNEEQDQHEYVENTAETWPVLKEPTEILLEELRKVDPVMAERWHPNDRRKIQRSLEIFLQTGRKASDIYAEQREQRAASNDDEHALSAEESHMRFPTLLFWVHAENEVLRERLDRRVEKMVAQGLLQEVETLVAFSKERSTDGTPVDETRGIWVSIGYKEFKEYIEALHQNNASEAEIDKLRRMSIERTQAATRQYAKRQLRWIRIKLVNSLSEAGAGDKLYLLDASDLDKYDERVVEPALSLTEQVLQGQDLPAAASMSSAASELLIPRRDYDLAATPDRWTKQHCTICNTTCVTLEQWQSHIKSKTHRRLVSKQRRPDGPNQEPS